MINYYERYKLLDSFMRCEDRIYKLAKNTPSLLRLILETSGVELPEDSKYFKSSNMMIITTDDIVGKDYIMYENIEYSVIFLPSNIRSDDYDIAEKIKALFRVLKEDTKKTSLYDLQLSLVPFLTVTAILSDIYAPFNDLADLIITALLNTKYLGKDKDNVVNMMTYINDNTSEDKFMNNLFSNSGIFTIIDRSLATLIVTSYNTFNK